MYDYAISGASSNELLININASNVKLYIIDECKLRYFQKTKSCKNTSWVKLMDHIFNFSHETFPAVQHSDIIYNALREISSAIFILDKELIPDR